MRWSAPASALKGISAAVASASQATGPAPGSMCRRPRRRRSVACRCGRQRGWRRGIGLETYARAGRMIEAVLIAGPTASGKSALAMALAETLGGIIVNADFDAGLSRPAHHHGAADARRKRRACRTGCSVMSMRRRIIRSGAGVADVARVLDDVRRQGQAADLRRRHRALFQGADHRACGDAADHPPTPRRPSASGSSAKASTALHAELAQRDPGAAARHHAARSFAHFCARWKWCWRTGRPIADWHREGMPPLIDADQGDQALPPPASAMS